MSTNTNPDDSKTPRGGVPNPLLDDLHKANEKFHHAREHVDQAHGALVNPFEERERASNEVRDAEKEIEAAEEKITKQLKQTPPPKEAAGGQAPPTQKPETPSRVISPEKPNTAGN